MSRKVLKAFIWTIVLALSFPVFSAKSTDSTSTSSNSGSQAVLDMIMHHIKDAHEWHLLTYTNDKGEKKDVVIPLPVILIDHGIQIFSSGRLYKDGELTTFTTPGGTEMHYLKNEALGYGLFHGEIYSLNKKGLLSFNKEEMVTNAAPLDLSITKNVFTVIFSALLILFCCRAAAKTYTREANHAPRGMAKFIEPFVIFVRDEIAIENIGPKKYKKYLPYLLTIFFFVWINCMLGLIPIFPGGANLAGNIAFTGILALFTFLITLFSANKNYWGHIFAMPGIPWPLLILMIPIELIGIFTKPFALMIRLFANMIAGHIIALALVGLIFIFGSLYWAFLSVPMGLFMCLLELLVALIQAYIFTMLSALFIGEAVAEPH